MTQLQETQQAGIARMTATTPAAPPAQEVYAAFAGNIDQAGVQKIFQGFGAAMTNNFTGVHLLFQSAGGIAGVLSQNRRATYNQPGASAALISRGLDPPFNGT